MDSKIRERINKLLALGTSPNQHEANSAILKAKQLMAEHKLSDRDFIKKDEVPIEVDTGLFYTTRKGKWISDITRIIAENNCCVHYLRTQKCSQSHRVFLYGYEEDVNICNNTLNYAIDCVNSLLKLIVNEIKKDPEKNTKAINYACESFGRGFCDGLQEAYKDQIEENQEWGLVMVIPPEVSKVMEGLKPGKWRRISFDKDMRAYNRGYEEGLRFTTKDKLETHAC